MVTALDVPCPFCKAAIGVSCAVISGRTLGAERVNNPHNTRVMLANKVADLLALPEAKFVYVRAQYVYCPYCGEQNDGWLGDPRGKETECDWCGKTYKVAENAEVKLS